MDNYLLIVVGIFTLICVAVGCARGFIKIAISLVATIAVIVVVMVATPKVSDALMNHTPLGDMVSSMLSGMVSGIGSTSGQTAQADVSEYSTDTIRSILKGLSSTQLKALGITDVDSLSDADIEAAKEKLADQGISVSEAAEKAGVTDSEDVDEAAEAAAENLSLQDQIAVINGVDMPAFLRNALLDNNNKEVYSQLGVDNFYDYVKHYVAKWVINIVAFLMTFLVAFIVVRIVIFSLDALSSLPVLHGMNRLAGGALGLGFALIFIWLAFMVITLMYTTAMGKQCFTLIGDSKILTLLYDNNILLKLLSK